jgi:hypothetical protein
MDYFQITEQNISSIDVSGNAALKTLDCYNQIKDLDLSKQPA